VKIFYLTRFVTSSYCHKPNSRNTLRSVRARVCVTVKRHNHAPSHNKFRPLARHTRCDISEKIAQSRHNADFAQMQRRLCALQLGTCFATKLLRKLGTCFATKLLRKLGTCFATKLLHKLGTCFATKLLHKLGICFATKLLHKLGTCFATKLLHKLGICFASRSSARYVRGSPTHYIYC